MIISMVKRMNTNDRLIKMKRCHISGWWVVFVMFLLWLHQFNGKFWMCQNHLSSVTRKSAEKLFLIRRGQILWAKEDRFFFVHLSLFLFLNPNTFRFKFFAFMNKISPSLVLVLHIVNLPVWKFVFGFIFFVFFPHFGSVCLCMKEKLKTIAKYAMK